MVTINDVAKRAGVSRGTVSNVINNIKVKPASKEKVDRAIQELGYIPNAYARGLKASRTNSVAFMLPTVWFPFFSELTNYIERELRSRGYKMFLCNSHDDYRVELEYIKMARENKVDGIISITYSDIAPYISSSIPLVTVERYFSSDIPFISTDNFEGGAFVAEKLTKLGCKSLLFVGRLAEKSSVAGLRRDGFASWCRERNIPCKELLLTCSSEQFVQKVYEFIAEHYTDGIPFDGIFAATDRYADYILDALDRCGSPVRPGKDLQIIGFDGAKSHAHDITRISSMRQPIEEIAVRAVETLDKLIHGKEPDYYTLLPAVFVQGRTTKDMGRK